MQWRNTIARYGAVAKGFHWTVALIMIAVICFGLWGAEFADGPHKAVPFFWHKSLGVVVLVLALPRLVWKLMNIRPLPIITQARWEIALAKLVHALLYWCMLTLPLSGWAMSSAGGRNVSVFGLFTLPPLLAPDKNLAHLFVQYHVFMAWSVIVLLGLHLAGALKHHFWDRDDTIRRMIPFGKLTGMAGAALIVFLALQPAQHTRAADVPPLPVWTIDHVLSHLTFEGTENRAPFKGAFASFDGTIAFDAARARDSHAEIKIKTADVSTGAGDIDENIGKKEWLDSESFPESVFTVSTFEKRDGDNYIAHGKLTIRGVTVPVDLPVTVKISGDTATAQGEVTLKRIDFGIGTGEWADPKVVGAEVTVKLALTAHRNIAKP